MHQPLSEAWWVWLSSYISIARFLHSYAFELLWGHLSSEYQSLLCICKYNILCGFQLISSKNLSVYEWHFFYGVHIAVILDLSCDSCWVIIHYSIWNLNFFAIFCCRIQSCWSSVWFWMLLWRTDKFLSEDFRIHLWVSVSWWWEQEMWRLPCHEYLPHWIWW